MKRILRKLKDFNELVMFQHSIFSLPFIFIAMVVSADGWFGWSLFFLGVAAAITARNFAMGLNRYADKDIDSINPRTSGRPSVDGRLDARAVMLFTIVNAAAFVIVAYMINMVAFWLSFPVLAVLGSYSYFKRFSSMAHVVLGVSLGLAPIAGVIAVEAAVPPWSVLLSFGVVFWVAGFDLLYSLQDIEFDKEHGLHSVPSRYGAEATLFISAVFHLVTVLFWAMFVWCAGLGISAFLAVAVSAAMLGYEHQIVRKDFTKIDRAFFTVNGYLGIIFLVLIILDKVIY
ncbi:MAG: 4-hydroxybenzoate polyprenyltransferase [Helicobacteraceae bacterium 4484_230]|nr:MAG: 4-hydroxybenzoate polyprenyltransferase [Helicobacteraceae bacterium 4484_230]